MNKFYKVVPLIYLLSLQLWGQGIHFPLEIIAANNLFNNRQFAAFDQNGKIHISYTGQSGTDGATREIYYKYETTTGFTDTVNISSNAVDDNYSTLSIDNNNKVHIGFTGRDAASLFQVKYTNNVSGNFFTPVYITAGGLNKATPFSKVGPDSVIHFVYFTYTNDPDNIYYINHDLRTGQSSSPQLLVAGETGGDFDASLDIDSNGKVHILVKSGSLFGGALKYYNNVQGTITEIPLPVTANVTTCKIAVDKANKVHIIYRLESELRLYYISDMNGSFSAPVPITPVGQRPSGMQNIAVDDSQRVYVIYQSSSSTSGKGFFLVYGQNGIFTDTSLVYELETGYVTRNSSAIIVKGNGHIAAFFTPGGVRDGIVLADIFMKQGDLFAPIPVELTSFYYTVENGTYKLIWEVESETNNSGFEIQKLIDTGWEAIAFVNGAGTSTKGNKYSFPLSKSKPEGNYRLKQIDFDGSITYSATVEVHTTNSPSYTMLGNYPNPFNPETTLLFTLADAGFIQLNIYNSLGELQETAYSGFKEAGVHELVWNANSLSSGNYFLVLTTDVLSSGTWKHSTVHKLILMK